MKPGNGPTAEGGTAGRRGAPGRITGKSPGKSPSKSRGGAAADHGGASISVDERRQLIAEAAWYRAEARGFAPGGEVDDWLAAEAEVDENLLRR